MSNYREDAIATAVASDEVWAGWRTLTIETAKAKASALIGIGIIATATATATAEATTKTTFIPQAAATAAAEATTRLSAITLAIEAAKASDLVLPARLSITASTSATVTAEVVNTLRVFATAAATASDTAIAHKQASALVIETAKAKAQAVFHGKVNATATATASAKALQRLHVAEFAQVAATATAQAFAAQGVPTVATAKAQIQAQAFTHIAAQCLISDTAVATAEALFTGGIQGQAWTANTTNWAMSRYAPYGFEHIAAINGELYGCNDDGVYRLSGGDEEISAKVVTGKIDFGGSLARPSAAYTEYELEEGTAEMEVTTTQSGEAVSYAYQLPPEKADELTNGRFVFGRGLRGRHFSFTLRLEGKRAHINDLSIQTAETKRRI